MPEEFTIKMRKDSVWKYSTFILGALLIVGIFVFLTAAPGSPGTGNVVSSGSRGNGIAEIDDDHFLGSEDAPVTIIEFSDYECPFCGRFYSGAYQDIKREYIDTGKAKLVFRDFPLEFHRNAQISAEAAECVGELGGSSAYFEMHDLIFENQGSLSRSNLENWAESLGYDISECLESGKFKSEVQKDFSDGQRAGVQGTPSFFINGKVLSGAQPFSVFQQAIEAEL
jgi:protein-disulfide isomerase